MGACGISIHALREEGDIQRAFPKAYVTIFLSTPSARRATSHRARTVLSGQISIHALREEGDLENYDSLETVKISIHALREEGDHFCFGSPHCVVISIHALREEGDVGLKLSECLIWISIHALREEGDAVGVYLCLLATAFLSTPSARRATWSSCQA